MGSGWYRVDGNWGAGNAEGVDPLRISGPVGRRGDFFASGGASLVTACLAFLAPALVAFFWSYVKRRLMKFHRIPKTTCYLANASPDSIIGTKIPTDSFKKC